MTVNYISAQKYRENFHWLLALLYGPYIRVIGTHYPYIRAVHTGRIYGPYVWVVCTGFQVCRAIWSIWREAASRGPSASADKLLLCT